MIEHIAYFGHPFVYNKILDAYNIIPLTYITFYYFLSTLLGYIYLPYFYTQFKT